MKHKPHTAFEICDKRIYNVTMDGDAKRVSVLKTTLFGHLKEVENILKVKCKK